MKQKLICFIYRGVIKNKKLGSKKRIMDNLLVLNPGKDIGKIYEEYYLKKIEKVLMLFVVIFVLGVIMVISDSQNNLIINGSMIKRNEYGEGKKDVTLKVEAEDVYHGDYEISVNEREYDYDEIMDIFEEQSLIIEREFLGENESADKVNKKVNMIETARDGNIYVEWEFNDNYIDSKGNLVADNIGEDGELLEINAILRYKEYYYEHFFNIVVFPPVYTPEETFINKLNQTIKSNNEGTLHKEFVELPSEVDGVKVAWKEENNFSGLMFLLLGLILGMVVMFSKDGELDKKVEERKKEMLSDYPEIVSKFSLMLSAGMTMYGVWERIVTDYSTKKKDEKIYRYAYEEMVITFREMQEGIPQLAALDRFGKRCKLHKYMKFSTLIIQNTRMGTKGIGEMLNNEAREALEERKNIAKQLAEEAGTKLLLPMVLMLFVVLVIIMSPALLNFSVI